MSELPAKTEISDTMSSDLNKRGCNFVGSTICYAFMQALGMVNDHLIDCFRYQEIRQAGAAHHVWRRERLTMVQARARRIPSAVRRRGSRKESAT